jgi:hypothetical protein
VTDSAAAPALAVALPGAATTARRSPRAVGEFLLVGGGTLLLLPFCWWYRTAFGLDEGELLMGALAFHAASLINDPHFSITYLLFYRDARGRAFGDAYAPRQRLRYWFAGLLVPLVLVAWAVAAVGWGSAGALGAMIQVMFVLVGWHYVKQGFGVLMVLSARRGVTWTSLERRALLAHCLAAWAYAWASPFDPGTRSVVNDVLYTTLPHPRGLEACAAVAFFASALGAVGMLVQKWRRERRPPPLLPLAGFAISIWLWTVYTQLDPLLMYWIPALHSLQYLYFVGLLRRNVALEAAGPPSFKGNVGRELALLALSAVALGWLSLRGLPGWLDAARQSPSSPTLGHLPAIGLTPYLAAFTAVINIHHYFMDSVIWRREHPETRHLSNRPVRAARDAESA